jgi:hypothetical protein
MGQGINGRHVTMASQLIIKSPQPGKQALFVVLTIAAFAGASFGAYYYGHGSAGYDHEVLENARDEMQQKLLKIDKENRELREQNAVLEQSKQIDKNAYNDVNGTLKRLQDEILELKEQVAFYRGIVSPTQAASGLNIARFQLNKLDTDAGYHFKLVLTQVKKNNSLIRGRANILIDGLQDGEPKQLNVSKLMGNSSPILRLQFKYFQTIEGDMVLPNGFTPSSILVDIRPSGRGHKDIKQTFNWMDIAS